MTTPPGLVARHPVGSGDLVRLLAKEGLNPELAAALTGFVPTEPQEIREELPVPEVLPPRRERVEVRPAATPPASSEIWRVSRQEWFPEALTGSSEPTLPEALARVKILDDEQLRARTLARPRVPPLAPWRRLAPALRMILSRPVQGSRIDARRLVERCARLQPLYRVPRTTRRRWAHRVRVLWDRAEVLAGFADDQRSVIRWLQRWRGPVGLDVVTVDDDGTLRPLRRQMASEDRSSGESWSLPSSRPAGGTPTPQSLQPDATAIALSDLGCMGPDLSRVEWWSEYGRGLRARGVRGIALGLVPARRLVRQVGLAWSVAPWERVRPHGRGAGEFGRACKDEAELTERLLDLLSVASRIDTAVLRGVRQLVAGADLGVESDVRYHQDVVFRSEQGIVLDPEVLSTRRQAFRQLPQQLREQVAAVLRQCHEDLAPCILHEELLLAGAEAEQAAALEFFARLARRVGEHGVHEPGFIIDSYVASWQTRREPACWEQDENAALWALAHRSPDGMSFDQALPDGLPMSRIAWALHRRDEVRWWRVVQRGTSLELSVVAAPDALHPAGGGFLLGHLPSRTGFLCLRSSEDRTGILPQLSTQQVCELPHRGRLRLESEGGVLELQSTRRPEWASSIVRRSVVEAAQVTDEGIGVVPWPTWAATLERDEFGAVAGLELAPGIIMQLRWIPPGRFLMGSPANERGRFGEEGPQRKVELTSGFWLAATTCTQLQWQAVMRSNPSEHQGEQHPIENVSWGDCREYCRRLNGRFPGLGMRLPTEAEWEYACRTGTMSAFNNGSPCSDPTGKDPALESLGWYGENSDGTTHPVAQKAANIWGLFDMHGNVWEWCEDRWQYDYKGAGTVDPTGPYGGQDRVIRGGCAWDFARNCRSACRYWGRPGDRGGDRGFRPAAGQPVRIETPEGVEQGKVSEKPSAGGKDGGTTDCRRARLRRPWSKGKSKRE